MVTVRAGGEIVTASFARVHTCRGYPQCIPCCISSRFAPASYNSWAHMSHLTPQTRQFPAKWGVCNWWSWKLHFQYPCFIPHLFIHIYMVINPYLMHLSGQRCQYSQTPPRTQGEPAVTVRGAELEQEVHGPLGHQLCPSFTSSGLSTGPQALSQLGAPLVPDS